MMSSKLDKFTYSTTYRNDYGKSSIEPGIDPMVEPGKVDCRPKAYVGEATGHPYENPLGSCPCQPGGNIPPRGAAASGMPTNLDKNCNCLGGEFPPQRPPAFNREEVAEMMHKAAETGNVKSGGSSCHNKSDMNPLTQPHPPHHQLQGHEPLPCNRQEKFRPVPVGQYGGQYEGPLNREPAEAGTKHNDQAMPFSFDKPCSCTPPRPEGGPQNYGPPWIRDEAADEPAIEGRMMGGSRKTSVPKDVAKLISQEPPAARVSCAPEADVSKFDQPNSFMRKLYDKYPYLYQILKDTPPEELIARVFKDRFLSTYQVDYLHMGAGKEHFPKGGEKMDEKFVSPEGEDETNMIPGCTYRSSKRTDFGKKNSGLQMKGTSDDKEDFGQTKEEPRVSEYMASISKLGGEIITDKLYALEAKTRKIAAMHKTDPE